MHDSRGGGINAAQNTNKNAKMQMQKNVKNSKITFFC